MTFTARQMAQSAIKSMHQSQTMEVQLLPRKTVESLSFSPAELVDCPVSVFKGCSSPIVVKFADTQKDKEQKRMAQQLQQQMQQLSAASMWGNLTGLNSLGPQYLAVSVCLLGTCSCNMLLISMLKKHFHQFTCCCFFQVSMLFLLSPPGCSCTYSCCSSQPQRGTHSTTCTLFQVNTHTHTLTFHNGIS